MQYLAQLDPRSLAALKKLSITEADIITFMPVKTPRGDIRVSCVEGTTGIAWQERVYSSKPWSRSIAALLEGYTETDNAASLFRERDVQTQGGSRLRWCLEFDHASYLPARPSLTTRAHLQCERVSQWELCVSWQTTFVLLWRMKMCSARSRSVPATQLCRHGLYVVLERTIQDEAHDFNACLMQWMLSDSLCLPALNPLPLLGWAHDSDLSAIFLVVAVCAHAYSAWALLAPP